MLWVKKLPDHFNDHLLVLLSVQYIGHYFSMRGQHQHQPQDAGRGHGSLRELYRAGGQPADQLCPRGLPEGNATISFFFQK